MSTKEEELETNAALKGHFKPSPATTNFMEKTTEEITNIKIDMKGMKKDIGFIKESLQKLENKLSKFIDECRSSFPNKNEFDKFEDETKDRFEKLEKFITKVMWTSVTGVLGFLISIIWFLVERFVIN